MARKESQGLVNSKFMRAPSLGWWWYACEACITEGFKKNRLIFKNQLVSFSALMGAVIAGTWKAGLWYL